MLISLVSAKGAPGVTTTGLALALAWPRPVLLADLDPRGGDLIWTYGQGQSTHGRGLLAAQVAVRHERWATALWAQVIALGADETRWLLPGLDSGGQAAGIDWASLARALSSPAGVDVIADCGQVGSSTMVAPVRAAADLVLLVTGSSLANVHATRDAATVLAAELRGGGWGADRLVSVIVGPGRPYPTADISRSLAEVAPVFGELPWDERAATALMSGRADDRRFERSALLGAAKALAHSIDARIGQSDAVAPEPAGLRAARRSVDVSGGAR